MRRNMTQDDPEPTEHEKFLETLKNIPELTVPQVAKIFQVTPYTVRGWLNEGILIGVKTGNGSMGRWRITKQEVVRFANDRFGSDIYD